jgi:predicted nucleic acid-binding Zn ribbon protein
MSDTVAYVPGVCNINTEEIASRRKVGHFGLIMFVVLLIIMLVANISHLYRVILFLPAFVASIGYLQARNKFCVGYASAGQQNASEGSKKASNIIDQRALTTDKQRARIMNLEAFCITVVITIVAIVLPHI